MTTMNGVLRVISLYEGVIGPSMAVRDGLDSAPHAVFHHEIHVWVCYEVQFGILFLRPTPKQVKGGL